MRIKLIVPRPERIHEIASDPVQKRNKLIFPECHLHPESIYPILEKKLEELEESEEVIIYTLSPYVLQTVRILAYDRGWELECYSYGISLEKVESHILMRELAKPFMRMVWR